MMDKKNANDSGDMLDDAFEQTGSHSAQEMHFDGLSGSSSSSEKVESENGYELSQQHWDYFYPPLYFF